MLDVFEGYEKYVHKDVKPKPQEEVPLFELEDNNPETPEGNKDESNSNSLDEASINAIAAKLFEMMNQKGGENGDNNPDS